MLNILYLCVFTYLHSEPFKLYAYVCVHCTLFHQNNVKLVKSGMNHNDRLGALVSKIR